MRCSHSPLPVLLPERVLEHLDLDRHRRCDLVQRGRVQGARDGGQAFQEWHGDGAIIGTVSALAGYVVGVIFKVP